MTNGPVKLAYWQKRRGFPIRNAIVLYDYVASKHKKIEYLFWEVMEHHPYIPDLSPRDYHIFGPLSKELGGRHCFGDLRLRPSFFEEKML